MNDKEIVALFWGRDQTAITYIAAKYGPRLRGLALGITGDAGDAEECVNDTYLKAWNAIPPHRPEGYLYPFLARITRQLALNVCRRRHKARVELFGDELEQCLPAEDSAVTRLDGQELARVLDDFLATLKDEQRRVFVRRYWYLDAIDDIADRFSLSRSKVTSILFRCRNRLRDYLKKEGYDL